MPVIRLSTTTIVSTTTGRHRPELIGGSSPEEQAQIEKWMDWTLCLGLGPD